MIYFDHAATSFPKSEKALQAFCHAATTYANAGRGSYKVSLDASRLIYQTREDIKRYFHVPNGEVVFTSGATMALNMVIKGIFHQGDHVLTTTLEHNSVLRPLYEIQKKGVQLDVISFTEDGIINIDELKQNIKPNTKAIIMTMASNVFGTYQPIQDIAKIAHEHHMSVIIVAAQAVGHCIIDMETLGIDILCFSGHKGLRTPRGIGAIVMREPFNISPLLSGGSGFLSLEKEQPSALPEHLEAGTLPIELIASLQATIQEQPQDDEKEMEVTTYFINQIKTIPNIKVMYEQNKHRRPVVSLYIKDISSDEMMDILSEDYDICTRGGIHCAPLLHQQLHTETCGLLRFSFSKNNTFDEIDIAVSAIRNIMEELCE